MKNILSIAFLAFSISACDSTESTEDDTTINNVEVDSAAVAAETSKTKIKRAGTLTKLWESAKVLNTPESVLFHDGVLYVSNAGGQDPSAKDNVGFISKLDTLGNVIELEWCKGLQAPKGMAIANDKLYVTDIDQFVEISLGDGSILNTYEVEGSVFLNDVTAINGLVYFSDWKTGKVHLLKEGEVSTFVEGLEKVNGLLAEEGRLLALTGSGLKSVDWESEEVTMVSDKAKDGDGIVDASNGDYVTSRWNGQVYLVSGSEAKLLLDTEKEKIQTADIGYLAGSNVVLVPTFFGNQVVAYQLK